MPPYLYIFVTRRVLNAGDTETQPIKYIQNKYYYKRTKKPYKNNL